MIEVTDLTVRYGKQQQRSALEGVSFTIGRGEFVLLSGPSGCGKSTLARSLNGLIPHASSAMMAGRVVVDGLETTAHSLPELAAHVGLVFQNPATQLFNATVEEEIAFAPRNLGLPTEEVTARVAFALDATGISHLRGRTIRALSSGEQQRVAIASVLVLGPQVLVLDEPTSNLDWRGVEQVMYTLARLRRAGYQPALQDATRSETFAQRSGLTILVIEHRLHAVAPLADRVLLMQSGRIVADGRPEDVFADKGRLIALGLRYPWVRDGEGRRGFPTSTRCRMGIAKREASSITQSPSYLTIQPPNYPTISFSNHSNIPSSYPLVAIQGLKAGYGSRTVLHGLDLALYPGEFVALVGDNGAGKSTLAKVLAGLLRPRQGRVTWNEKLRRLPLGRRVGLLFQNPLDQLVCDTVEEEIAFGLCNLEERGSLDVDRSETSAQQERVEATLAAAGLTALRHRRSAALSVGEQQRTALAAALSTAPCLLILDEPTMGQDWAHLSRLMEALVRLNYNGQAILLITHDDKLVCRYAERIILLEEGCIGGEWRMEDR
jgi:energy-coupling factor transporter ATP-binding protein EcfA2